MCWCECVGVRISGSCVSFSVLIGLVIGDLGWEEQTALRYTHPLSLLARVGCVRGGYRFGCALKVLA